MMVNKFPKVSVGIPTYNYGHFISDAIESVLAQTFTDFELIVVDNCSTDNTEEVVENYANHDARIKYIRNKTNLGMVENWNRCLHYATGAYVKILCADDLLEPTCLERSSSLLGVNPQVALVSCARLMVTKDLRPLDTLNYSNKFELVKGSDAINKCLLRGNLIGEPTAVLFRRKYSERGFNEDYKQSVDLEMWFNLLEKGDFAYIPETLCRFRQHEDQATRANLKLLLSFGDQYILLKNYIDKEYVRIPFLKKQELKFNVAYSIWSQRESGLDASLIRLKINQYYDYNLFCLLLAFKKIKKMLGKYLNC